MRYNLTSTKAPKMPILSKGTECIKFLASQISGDMRAATVPMFFPVLGAHVKGAEFLYPDNTWKEVTGMMSHLVADSGMGKGQFGAAVEAMMRTFREHDAAEFEKLVEWQKSLKVKAANKEKPARPDVCFWFPPADVTNAAFIQNAMALEQADGHTQYINMPEIEMADKMCGGHKQFSQTARNIYDRQRAGALRATADGVTGNPIMRVNMTFSSTPYAARKFYKNELFNGTLGRIVFSYKARQERRGKIPRQGNYSDDYLKTLDEYLSRLAACHGRIIIEPLNRLIDKMAGDMATIADLADDDIFFDMSKRALANAWKAGCIMYVLNGMQWTTNISNVVEWLVYHDMWSKMQIFGDMLGTDSGGLGSEGKRGPRNMLESLPETFSLEQLEALRTTCGKSKEGAKNQVFVWTNRGFVTYSYETQLYTKVSQPVKKKKNKS